MYFNSFEMSGVVVRISGETVQGRHRGDSIRINVFCVSTFLLTIQLQSECRNKYLPDVILLSYIVV